MDHVTGRTADGDAQASTVGDGEAEPVSVQTPTVIDRCDITVVHPQTVAAAQQALIDQPEARRVADVFRVLGDPSRCRLVYALLAAGEICVCDLAAAIGMSESSVSHHLRILRAHGLVRPRRQGKMVYYAPDDEHISLLLDLTREHVAHAEGPAKVDPAAAVLNPQGVRSEAGT
jgi:ArsR family transcriptional regulator, lead/cadmium/zinc/bismuth-responsive transcriptional repressor